MPACAAVLALYALIFVLHLIVPGRWVAGYVRDEHGAPLRYRLNGLRVMAIVVGLYLVGGLAGLYPWDYLYLHRWEAAFTACALGLVFTAAIGVSRMITTFFWVQPEPRRSSAFLNRRSTM